MNDVSTHDSETAAGEDPDSSKEDALTELRRLLLEPEQKQLCDLQKRLEGSALDAENISAILPEAIILGATRDRRLTNALMPTVAEIVKRSIKEDLKTFVDAFFPVMGPAIRKAIAETLRKMIQSLNNALEKSFSWQGMKWRLEAVRTGKPFAEVVLLHNLIYRVDQVFLIHRETGLMLQHVVAESPVLQDADTVSGMLTAIQDFVNDSFETRQTDMLETLQVGQFTVWIEQGPHAVLAGVIRGDSPQELRSVFEEALENIHLEKSDNLQSFEGDVTPFESIRHHLEDCLQAQYKASKKRAPPLLWFVLGTLLLTCGLGTFFAVRTHLRWMDFLAKLNAAHGIVVTMAEKRSGKYFVTGLRDPLAVDPNDIIEETKLDSQKVLCRWEPYQALTAEFVLARSKKLLRPPDTVALKLIDDTLLVTGSASHQWLSDARMLARAIPGVARLREDNLIDLDLREMHAIKETLEKWVLAFEAGSTRIKAETTATMRAVTAEFLRLQRLALQLGHPLRIQIVGHTDASGTEEINRRLSRERADAVRSLLVSRGISPGVLSAVGVGTSQPVRQELTAQDRAMNRSVTFRVILGAYPNRRNR